MRRILCFIHCPKRQEVSTISEWPLVCNYILHSFLFIITFFGIFWGLNFNLHNLNNYGVISARKKPRAQRGRRQHDRVCHVGLFRHRQSRLDDSHLGHREPTLSYHQTSRTDYFVAVHRKHHQSAVCRCGLSPPVRASRSRCEVKVAWWNRKPLRSIIAITWTVWRESPLEHRWETAG